MKNTIIFVLVATLLSFGIIIYLRDSIFPIPPDPLDASRLGIPLIVKSKIKNVVENKNSVSAIQIVTVDFQKNIRLETLFMSDSDIIDEMYARFVRDKVVETPLFTGNKANNDRVLKLINGEFLCTPFNQSTAYRYAPQAEQFVKTVCAIGIPPEKLGEFSGMLTIYLNTEITPEQRSELFLFSRDISTILSDYNSKNGNIRKRRLE